MATRRVAGTCTYLSIPFRSVLTPPLGAGTGLGLWSRRRLDGGGPILTRRRLRFPSSPLLAALALLLVPPLTLFPELLAAGHGLEQLFVVVRFALLAVVGPLEILREDAHPHADVVLPCLAGVALDPSLGVGGAADAADVFFFVFRLFGLLLFLGLRVGSRVFLVEALVLALRRADRPPWFCLS